VRNERDESGDLKLVQSKKNENHAYWNFANHFTHNAAGGVTSMQLSNGRWESTQFNSRLQPTQIALGKIQSATDLLRLDYQYGDRSTTRATLPVMPKTGSSHTTPRTSRSR
jgi:hypothetical protein